jgi:hypothetical protein
MAKQFVKTLHQCAEKFQIELCAYALTENGYEILLRPSLANLEGFMKRLHALMNQQKSLLLESERLFYRCVLVQDEFTLPLLQQMRQKHHSQTSGSDSSDSHYWYECARPTKGPSQPQSLKKSLGGPIPTESLHFRNTQSILGTDQFIKSIQIKLLYEKSLSSVA